MVEVRESGKGREDGLTRRVAHLNGECVKRPGGAGFCGVDVQPEREGRRANRRRYGYCLLQSVGMGGSVTIQPGIPRTSMRRLPGIVVYYA